PETLPHGGVTRTPAYLASEFCRGCHQFGADGYVLNGKLLEDTYAEWKASRFAAAGVQCQDCHMPDRRHLWRGIHDPEMVRGGLTITVVDDQPRGPGAVARELDGTAVAARFSVIVSPGAFSTGFFEALLRQGAGRGEEDVRRALDDTRRSAFIVFEAFSRPP